MKAEKKVEEQEEQAEMPEEIHSQRKTEVEEMQKKCQQLQVELEKFRVAEQQAKDELEQMKQKYEQLANLKKKSPVRFEEDQNTGSDEYNNQRIRELEDDKQKLMIQLNECQNAQIQRNKEYLVLQNQM